MDGAGRILEGFRFGEGSNPALLGGPGGRGRAEASTETRGGSNRDPCLASEGCAHLHGPHLTRTGISSAPPAVLWRKAKVKGGREGFGPEEIAAP